MYIALTLVDQETWFRVAQATMSFILFLALIGMAPFTTFYAVGDPIRSSPREHALFYTLFVVAGYVIACTCGRVRERTWRSVFVSNERLFKGG